MRALILLSIFLILPFTFSSLLSIHEHNEPHSSPFSPESHWNTEPLIPHEALGYDINVTIDLANTGFSYCGILLTSQQLDSLFPPMKNFTTPENVTINIQSKINPFHILNFTDFHLSLDLNAQVNVFLPNVSANFPYTTFNITGYVQLILVPVYDLLIKFRLYIKDFDVENVIVPSAELAKINAQQVQDNANSIGQFGVDYVNQVLMQKSFMMSEHGYLITENPRGTHHDRAVTIDVKSYYGGPFWM